MKSRDLVLLLCVLLALVPFSAADTVLFNSGAYNGGAAYTVNNGYSSADDFILTSASSISSFNVSLWTNTGSVVTSFDWSIRANNGTVPGAILASGNSGSLTHSFQGNIFNVFDVNLYNFQQSVSLGNGTYWLVLTNAVSSGGNFIAWSSTDPNGTTLGVQWFGNNPPNHFDNLSFQVNGTTETPEPSSLIMLMSGFAATGGVLRRKRSI